MGYELIAKNKKIKSISMGLKWPIILQETGAGYILGYGSGRTPGSYVYQTGNHGSPSSNDGYIVSSGDSKMMAKILRGYISVQRFINKEWEKIPDPEKQRQINAKIMDSHKPLYKPPMAEGWMKTIEDVAIFMENSNGFRIY